MSSDIDPALPVQGFSARWTAPVRPTTRRIAQGSTYTRPLESAIESRLAAAEARVKELEGFIDEWDNGHGTICAASDGRCICGYAEARKALNL